MESVTIMDIAMITLMISILGFLWRLSITQAREMRNMESRLMGEMRKMESRLMGEMREMESRLMGDIAKLWREVSYMRGYLSRLAGDFDQETERKYEDAR